MGTRKSDVPRSGMRIGGLAGAIAFIFIGLRPALYFGGAAALVALSFIAPDLNAPERVVALLGSAAGGFLTLAVFMTAGAIAGFILGLVVLGMTGGEKSPEGADEPGK